MGAPTQCESALTRHDPSNSEVERIFPSINQVLILDQCLHAATMGGAYEARMENKIGSIKFGKNADFVVLEEDRYSELPNECADLPIFGTMMGGTFTHRDGL